jgi:hypothetical protein
MKKVTLPLAAIALVGFYASSASAQCAFNSAPAKGVKGSMVRNYSPCPGTETPNSNTTTEGATPACTPVTPRQNLEGDSTLYSFDKKKGKCDVSTKAKLEKSCATVTGTEIDMMTGKPVKVLLGLQDVPCHVTYVKSKCSGILGTDGLTPIGNGDAGWSLATLSRATLNDPTNGDMTVIDFPVTFNYSIPSKGKMAVDSNSAEALAPIVGTQSADLPTCTSIEVVDVTIKAPGGLPFAKLGQSTRPKN